VTLLPGHYETFVLVQSLDVVMDKISKATTSRMLLQNQEANRYVFTGWSKGERFRISLKITKPNNYIPLIVGKAEATSSGCLVFVTYKLFPVTSMFLVFWSLFIALIGIVTTYQYQSYVYCIAATGIIAFTYWIVWSNFKIQLRLTRQALLKVLT